MCTVLVLTVCYNNFFLFLSFSFLKTGLKLFFELHASLDVLRKLLVYFGDPVIDFWVKNGGGS